jgi:hypothetical protein
MIRYKNKGRIYPAVNQRSYSRIEITKNGAPQSAIFCLVANKVFYEAQEN